MRIGLYGMPTAGKSYILDKIDFLEVMSGSVLLNEICPTFDSEDDHGKNMAREELAKRLLGVESFIMDGHYAFGDKVAFTDMDGQLYDVILYLYISPDVLIKRMRGSDKNKKYLSYDIEKWQLIAITKSDSGISGPELAKAHIRLGELLAENIDLEPADTTVVALLRGGIFFAQGIYFKLGCKFEVYDPKKGEFTRPTTKNIILADSVINTGKTMVHLIDDDVKVACCVINDKAVPLFDDKLYTVRVSTNSFVGSAVKTQKGNKGPDTAMRLFNQL
jgi:hypothetical protein